MIRLLRRKFVFIAMLSFALLLLLLAVSIITVNYLSMENAADHALRFLLNDVDAPEKPQRPIAAFGYQLEGSVGFAVRSFTATFDEAGNIVEMASGFGSRDLPSDAETVARRALDRGEESGKLASYKYLLKAAKSGGEAAFVDITVQAQMLLGTLGAMAVVSVAGMALMFVIVLLVSRRAIRPIAENFEKQQRFLADAGHEIKTPLAIIQSNADAMELRMGANKWLANIRAQIARMDGLTKSLLALADGGDAPYPMEKVNFSALLANCLRSHDEIFTARGLRVHAELAPNVVVNGNREALVRLADTLADNAAKYASEQSVIHATLRVSGLRATYELINACDSLPTVPPDRLFDRFYRADEARTQKAGGYGIGLSIARSVAERHHGRVQAYFDDARTIRFKTELPIL